MRRIVLLVASIFVSTQLIAENLVLHVGTLLAIPGEPPLKQQTVIVKDNKIIEISAGYSESREDHRLLDLKEYFVLPGLMDMHVHLLTELGPESRSRRVTDSATFTAFRGAANARKTLHSGFTTVRDLGGNPDSIFAIRDAIKAGLIPGPRVFAAGSSLAATGGHGDIDGIRSELMKIWTPETICDGAVDCRKATRHAIKYGADWIKITATGGVLSDTATGLGVQMTHDELTEIMNTAHNLGVRVAAHAHGADGINAALKAGVDSIDHGTFLNRESIRLFKKNDAYLVPTLMPGHFIPLTMEGNPFFTDSIKKKSMAAAAKSKQNFAMAQKAGVKIAFGTDTGVTPHGQNAREFTLMVAAGMPAGQAIRAATIVASEMLEIADELGTLEPGKLADLIAVKGDPTTDISVLEQIAVVIKDGKVEKFDAK